jgi:hypothetical protein
MISGDSIPHTILSENIEDQTQQLAVIKHKQSFQTLMQLMIMIIKYENNMYKWEKLCAFFHHFLEYLEYTR